MHSVGKFLTHFRRLGLQGFQVGGDEGYGHQLMDRMVEEGHEHFLRVLVDRRSTHRTSSRTSPLEPHKRNGLKALSILHHVDPSYAIGADHHRLDPVTLPPAVKITE